TPAWSLKFEYDYMQFADHNVPTPASNVINPATGVATAVVGPNTSTAQEAGHAFKIGLNYHWGMDPREGWRLPTPAPAHPVKAIDKARRRPFGRPVGRARSVGAIG